MALYTGVSGAVREITKIPVGVSGAVRNLTELDCGVSGAVRNVFTSSKCGKRIISDLNDTMSYFAGIATDSTSLVAAGSTDQYVPYIYYTTDARKSWTKVCLDTVDEVQLKVIKYKNSRFVAAGQNLTTGLPVYYHTTSPELGWTKVSPVFSAAYVMVDMDISSKCMIMVRPDSAVTIAVCTAPFSSTTPTFSTVSLKSCLNTPTVGTFAARGISYANSTWYIGGYRNLVTAQGYLYAYNNTTPSSSRSWSFRLLAGSATTSYTWTTKRYAYLKNMYVGFFDHTSSILASTSYALTSASSISNGFGGGILDVVYANSKYVALGFKTNVGRQLGYNTTINGSWTLIDISEYGYSPTAMVDFGDYLVAVGNNTGQADDTAKLCAIYLNKEEIGI